MTIHFIFQFRIMKTGNGVPSLRSWILEWNLFNKGFKIIKTRIQESSNWGTLLVRYVILGGWGIHNSTFMDWNNWSNTRQENTVGQITGYKTLFQWPGQKSNWKKCTSNWAGRMLANWNPANFEGKVSAIYLQISILGNSMKGPNVHYLT